jgi:predicted porin
MPFNHRLSLLAFTCAALVATPAAALTTTIYGRFVVSANDIKTGNSSSLQELRDNASRLGFRGVEDLGGGLQALFGLEMGLSGDTGLTTTPAYRNSYVALRAGWGTVAFGRLDSANPTGSPLYSQITALTHFAPNDAGATATSTAMQNARNRTDNSFGYMSPKWGGFDLRARYYWRGVGSVADPENNARSFDLGLNYVGGGFKVALGMARDGRKGGLLNNEFEDKLQYGVNYAVMPGWELYAFGGLDHYKNTATSRRDVSYWQLGTAYRTGNHKVVFNLFEREVQTSLTGKRKREQLSYQYSLSKRTELQFFYDNDGIDSSRSNVRVRALGAGVRHDF